MTQLSDIRHPATANDPWSDCVIPLNQAGTSTATPTHMKTRIGSKMAQVQYIVSTRGPTTLIDVAREVGPHGSLQYGYAIVHRAIRAGLVGRTVPLPGRRGRGLATPEQIWRAAHPLPTGTAPGTVHVRDGRLLRSYARSELGLPGQLT